MSLDKEKIIDEVIDVISEYGKMFGDIINKSNKEKALAIMAILYITSISLKKINATMTIDNSESKLDISEILDGLTHKLFYEYIDNLSTGDEICH